MKSAFFIHLTGKKSTTFANKFNSWIFPEMFDIICRRHPVYLKKQGWGSWGPRARFRPREHL